MLKCLPLTTATKRNTIDTSQMVLTDYRAIAMTDSLITTSFVNPYSIATFFAELQLVLNFKIRILIIALSQCVRRRDKFPRSCSPSVQVDFFR